MEDGDAKSTAAQPQHKMSLVKWLSRAARRKKRLDTNLQELIPQIESLQDEIRSSSNYHQSLTQRLRRWVDDLSRSVEEHKQPADAKEALTLLSERELVEHQLIKKQLELNKLLERQQNLQAQLNDTSTEVEKYVAQQQNTLSKNIEDFKNAQRAYEEDLHKLARSYHEDLLRFLQCGALQAPGFVLRVEKKNRHCTPDEPTVVFNPGKDKKFPPDDTIAHYIGAPSCILKYLPVEPNAAVTWQTLRSRGKYYRLTVLLAKDPEEGEWPEYLSIPTRNAILELVNKHPLFLNDMEVTLVDDNKFNLQLYPFPADKHACVGFMLNTCNNSNCWNAEFRGTQIVSTKTIQNGHEVVLNYGWKPQPGLACALDGKKKRKRRPSI